LPGDAYGAPLGLAHFYLYWGVPDKAIDWTEKAIEQRQPSVLFFVNVHVQQLRSSPRWPGKTTKSAAQNVASYPDIQGQTKHARQHRCCGFRTVETAEFQLAVVRWQGSAKLQQRTKTSLCVF
jgi:hypothetical protein